MLARAVSAAATLHLSVFLAPDFTPSLPLSPVDLLDIIPCSGDIEKTLSKITSREKYVNAQFRYAPFRFLCLFFFFFFFFFGDVLVVDRAMIPPPKQPNDADTIVSLSFWHSRSPVPFSPLLLPHSFHGSSDLVAEYQAARAELLEATELYDSSSTNINALQRELGEITGAVSLRCLACVSEARASIGGGGCGGIGYFIMCFNRMCGRCDDERVHRITVANRFVLDPPPLFPLYL